MKKIVLLSFVLLILVGCNKDKKIYLEDKYYQESSIVEIDNTKLKSLEKDKESFALSVYLSGCTTCNQFRGVLNNFVNSNKLTIYSISILETTDTEIDGLIKYAPSLVIYEDGKILNYLDAVSDEHIKYFTSVDEFSIWFSNYVYLEK